MRTENTSSEIIREQPSSTSPKVVEKGKASGRKFDSSLVGKARRRAAASGAHAKVPTTAARSTSAAPGHGSKKPVKSKVEFVRGLPSNTPAKAVVAQAKAAGMSVTESYIYSVRSADRRAERMSAANNSASRRTTTAASIVRGSTPGPKVSARAEALLKAVAAEIGLGSAIELLQSERARVQSLIGG